jgi:SAM-dependent methyltransferase
MDRLKRRADVPRAPVTTPAADFPAPSLLSSLYTPSGDGSAAWYFDDPKRSTVTADSPLPLPPPHLRMGYAEHDDKSYLGGGRVSADRIRELAAAHGCDLSTRNNVLDWGCASGRTLRHFAGGARSGEYWGADQDGASIAWAKENLCPPFRFVTCTAYPHFPFEDAKFDLIYGLSVFTHLEHLRDLWLMEINRVLRRQGHAIFTIHDEHTARFMAEQQAPQWIPADLNLAEIARHDATIIHGSRWFETYTFLTGDHIRREWGRYFEVLEIRPLYEGYQSAVMLRKNE